MKKFKRIFAVFFCLLLAAGILGGCGKAASSSAPAPSALQSGNKPLKIVTTIFPEYDWVREILGDKADRAEVTMLLDNGVDLHSYQPTAEGGAVKFRPGPVYRCAQCGGFGVLDEINMAKNEALAVLHAVLDFRRAIDVPGYERIPLAEETRFIATMNYGYAGTRELNEALTSRFVVIQMPTITQDNLEKLLRTQFPDLHANYVHQFALLFLDLQKKCDSAEISTKALDLRGMLDALRLIRRGVPAGAALDMGITNKAFDSYEQGLIRDVIAARIPAQLTAAKLFR